jgi:hypothetical protein
MDTRSFATTPGKIFVTPRSSRTGIFNDSSPGCRVATCPRSAVWAVG